MLERGVIALFTILSSFFKDAFDLFISLLSFLEEHLVGISMIGTFLAALIPIWQYVHVKKSENRKHTFEAYHKLIENLVGSPDPRLDRQIAVVYELRNFEDYFPVTVRILAGVRSSWATKSNANDLIRILSEIELTIAYIRDHKKYKKNPSFD